MASQCRLWKIRCFEESATTRHGVEIPAHRIAEPYARHRLMLEPASGDALHLALASVHEADYLLTWNVRHLANPNKVEHMTVINRRLGLLLPVIICPESLWMEDEP